MNLYNELIALQDKEYQDFDAKLIPNKEKDYFIGVRMPILRKFANEFNKSDQKEEFMNTLPHTYYEENQIHKWLIEKIKDYDTFIYELKRFVPFMCNWAETDGFRNTLIEKHSDEFLVVIKEWLNDNAPFTKRFGIDMLMEYYLKDNYKKEYIDLVCSVKDDGEYYVKIMISWYLATAMIDHFDDVVDYLLSHDLDKWIHNKAIQKAIESFRITDDAKTYLRTLKK